MNKLFIPLVFALFLLTGCENNDFMQSESTVNGKLKGSWKLYGSSSTNAHQKWTMDNGSLTIYATSDEHPDSVIDRGTYTVLTKFSKCYVTIAGLSTPTLVPWDMNTRWNISQLSNTVLYITTTSNSGTIISREFVKQ